MVNTLRANFKSHYFWPALFLAWIRCNHNGTSLSLYRPLLGQNYFILISHHNIILKFQMLLFLLSKNLCLYSIIYRTHNESHECNLEEVYREIVYFDGSVYFVKHFCTSELQFECPTEHYNKISIEVSMKSFQFTQLSLFGLICLACVSWIVYTD